MPRGAAGFAVLVPLIVLVLSMWPTAAAAAERQKITMWFWGASPEERQALRKALVIPFNSSQRKYELTIQFRTSVDNDVRVAAIANKGPDIVYTSGPGDVWPLARAGKLEPLDALAEKYGWNERLLPPVLNTCRELGHLYCVPPSLIVNGMFYNKAVLRENGWRVPRTAAELEAVMKAAQAKGLYASVTGDQGWQPVDQDYVSLFLNQMVGPERLYDVLTGRSAWTSPDMVAAISALDRWYKAGYLGGSDYFVLDFDESMSLLQRRRSPFFFGPTLAFQWAKKYFTGADSEDLGFAPFPQMNSARPYPIYDIGSSFTLSINANSRVKAGAAQVLNMILSPQFVLRISEAWPGYWSVPLRHIPHDPGAVGVVRAYYQSLAEISAAVRNGTFGYNLSSFFPNRTAYLLGQDIESVWVNEETPLEMLTRAGKVFARERQLGRVLDSIPAPILNTKGNPPALPGRQ